MANNYAVPTEDNQKPVTTGDVASGRGGKVFDLSSDVDLVAQSPNGNSLPRIITLLTEGTLVGTNDLDAPFSLTSLPAGTHIPYVFKTLSPSSTATVAVGW